jgi:hypothetical protein
MQSSESPLVFPGGRPLHADALGSVPTAYLPTGGLVDLLAARVYHPSARCVVRRGDDFPVAGPVRETIADLKLHREDLGVGRWLALFLGSAGWRLSSTGYFSGRRGQNGLVGHRAPPGFGGSVHARYQEARTPVRVTRRARWEAVVSLRLKGPERTREWLGLRSARVLARRTFRCGAALLGHNLTGSLLVRCSGSALSGRDAGVDSETEPRDQRDRTVDRDRAEQRTGVTPASTGSRLRPRSTAPAEIPRGPGAIRRYPDRRLIPLSAISAPERRSARCVLRIPSPGATRIRGGAIR